MNTKLNRRREDLLESKRNREKQNDTEIQGEVTGAIYRNGPISSRACTDSVFCVFYLIFLAFLLSISIVGYVDGDIRYLSTGYDTDSVACGIGDAANYPYLYFAEPDVNTSVTVCVSSCPSNSEETLDCLTNSAITDCSQSEIYASTASNGVVCLPTDSDLYSDISGLLSQGYWEDFTEIFIDSWQSYLAALAFSYLLASLLLILMLFFPRCVAWTFIVSSISLILIAASLFMILYANPELLSSSISSSASGLQLAISIILFLISAFAIAYVFFKMKKIAGALAFMETTSLFIKQIWTSMFLPLAFLLIFLAYLIYTLYFSLLFLTLGEPQSEGSSSPFGLIWPDSEGWAFLIFHLIGAFVNLAFLSCSYLFILNAACSYWYFSTPVVATPAALITADNSASEDAGKKAISSSSSTKVYPIWQAIKIYWRYHCGSVVFGSILISLFSWFNFLFGHLYNKIAKWRDFAEANSFRHVILTGILSLFCLYEKFIRYISRNAFVQITITGSPFYTASKDAFYLVQRNHNSYYPIQGIGDFIILLGQIFIILATGIGTFICVLEFVGDSLAVSLEVTAVVLVLAFITAYLTMLIYSAINDAILLNYLLDVEIEINNYGKSEPYHAPAPLKSFLRDPENQKELRS